VVCTIYYEIIICSSFTLMIQYGTILEGIFMEMLRSLFISHI